MVLAEAIRRTAKRQGLTLEAFRKQAGIPNSTFYNLLAGRPPRVLRTLERLKGAGVPLPRDTIKAA